MAGISPSLRPPRLLRRAFAAPARLWERLTLFLRLAAVLSTCLGAGAVLIFSLLIRDNIRTNSQELHEQAAREVELLTSLLTEYAILGDYGSIGQTLRRITSSSQYEPDQPCWDRGDESLEFERRGVSAATAAEPR